jgi:type IV secretory pathway VirB10-like protein
MGATTDDKMSPSASPGSPSGKSGVRRVNNRPLYIVVAGLGAFLLVMILVASDRASNQNEPGKREDVARNGDTAMFAMKIAGEQKDGIIQAKASPPAVPDFDPPFGVALADPPIDPAAPIVPPASQQGGAAEHARSVRDEEAGRIRMMKLQQLDEAVKARTSLATNAPRGPASSAAMGAGPDQRPAANRDEVLARLTAVRQEIETGTRDDPTAAYNARLELLRGGGANVNGANAGQRMAPLQGRNDIASFAGTGQGDRWRLNSRPEAPASPYELRAGFVVPATLISGVNSELPGQIVAQVSQDVYDTPLGRHKLIPQGARLVGSYASDIAFGQKRILVAWQRIVFPDGKAMDTGAMPGADSAGYAGFKDQVNNHYVRLFSSAVLMSAVTAGIAMSQPESGGTNARPTSSSAISEALGQQLGQVTAQLIAKNLNIAPTLEIRPGYRFNVIVTKDMTFSKPYVAFDY